MSIPPDSNPTVPARSVSADVLAEMLLDEDKVGFRDGVNVLVDPAGKHRMTVRKREIQAFILDPKEPAPFGLVDNQPGQRSPFPSAFMNAPTSGPPIPAPTRRPMGKVRRKKVARASQPTYSELVMGNGAYGKSHLSMMAAHSIAQYDSRNLLLTVTCSCETNTEPADTSHTPLEAFDVLVTHARQVGAGSGVVDVLEAAQTLLALSSQANSD